jgi:hypothetical protein
VNWWSAFNHVSPDGKTVCIPLAHPRAFAEGLSGQVPQLYTVPHVMKHANLCSQIHLIGSTPPSPTTQSWDERHNRLFYIRDDRRFADAIKPARGPAVGSEDAVGLVRELVNLAVVFRSIANRFTPPKRSERNTSQWSSAVTECDVK